MSVSANAFLFMSTKSLFVATNSLSNYGLFLL
jgi:hypothetical protein